MDGNKKERTRLKSGKKKIEIGLDCTLSITSNLIMLLIGDFYTNIRYFNVQDFTFTYLYK